MFKKICATGLVLLLATTMNVMGHPGPLDKAGCHQCEENCAQWGLYDGQFHCHNKNLYGETALDWEQWKEMLCHAIYNKHLVKVVMKLGGAADQQYAREEAATDPGIREMVLMPFAYGLDDLGQPVFRAFRLTGDSSERTWQTYSMANIMELQIVNVTFEEYKEGATDEGIFEIQCQHGVEQEAAEEQ